MPVFHIKEGFFSQAADKLMTIGLYFKAEERTVIDELKKFEAMGSCKEIVPIVEPEKEIIQQNPNQDLSVVPGIGEKTLQALTAANVKTVDQLKASFDKPEVKAALGINYDKVVKYFSPDA